jgi:hypothetical protein
MARPKSRLLVSAQASQNQGGQASQPGLTYTVPGTLGTNAKAASSTNVAT